MSLTASASRVERQPEQSVGTQVDEPAIGDIPLLAAGLAISSLLVGGMFLESRILMLGGALAAFVAGLVAPPVGLVVLATMGPLKPPPVIPAPGFNLVLVITIVLGCVYRLPVDRPHLAARPAMVLLTAFVGYVFVQQLPDMLGGYSGDRAHDVGYLFYQLSAGFGAIAVGGYLLRGRSPYAVVVALLVSAAFAVFLALATADGADGRLANLVPQADAASRATGPFGNPNSFGQFLAYACCLAAAWVVTARSPRPRMVLLAILAVLGYSLTLSLSRGAIATLFAGLVALAFTRNRRLGIVASAMALAFVVVGYPLFVQWRLTTEAGAADAAAEAELAASDESRIAAVLAGPALFEISPVFGIGFGQYRFMSGMVTDEGAGLVAHNWYGTVLAEQGVLGISVWMLMLVSVGIGLMKRPSQPRSVGWTMLVALSVGSMFLSPPTSLQTSILPALAITAALVGDWAAPSPLAGAQRARPENRRSSAVQAKGAPNTGS